MSLPSKLSCDTTGYAGEVEIHRSLRVPIHRGPDRRVWCFVGIVAVNVCVHLCWFSSPVSAAVSSIPAEVSNVQVYKFMTTSTIDCLCLSQPTPRDQASWKSLGSGVFVVEPARASPVRIWPSLKDDSQTRTRSRLS